LLVLSGVRGFLILYHAGGREGRGKHGLETAGRGGLPGRPPTAAPGTEKRCSRASVLARKRNLSSLSRWPRGIYSMILFIICM